MGGGGENAGGPGGGARGGGGRREGSAVAGHGQAVVVEAPFVFRGVDDDENDVAVGAPAFEGKDAALTVFVFEFECVGAQGAVLPSHRVGRADEAHHFFAFAGSQEIPV